LPDGLLAESYDIEVVVLADCCIEIELALHHVLSHHRVVVLVADLLVYQVVTLVLLRVRAHIASILRLDASEVQDLGLFLLSLGVTSDLAPTFLARLVGW